MDNPSRGAGWASLATLAVIVALWWAVTASGLIAPLFLPGPGAVGLRIVDLARNGFVGASLWQHAGASLARVGLAMLFAVVTAIPVGMAMGLSRRINAALDPLIEFYRPVPPLAYLPLIVIWCGIGEATKVILITLAIFAPLAIATASGVRRVDADRVRAARSLGASRDQVVWLVIFPSALPDILTGLRIALGVGWSTLVAAELVAATRGLGFMVQSASQMLVTDVVIAGILLIAVIALAIELVLRWVERRFAGWSGTR
ncbi:taurine ABC transporter permease TauC [Novosphingobium sp.]|uniref:taurine ABC transporter permease TauC n=1 Tax=Novosphingobium sp. TaxID=1874826 RepID=UPI00333E346F